jgi:hypothetical protein
MWRLAWFNVYFLYGFFLGFRQKSLIDCYFLFRYFFISGSFRILWISGQSVNYRPWLEISLIRGFDRIFWIEVEIGDNFRIFVYVKFCLSFWGRWHSVQINWLLLRKMLHFDALHVAQSWVGYAAYRFFYFFKLLSLLLEFLDQQLLTGANFWSQVVYFLCRKASLLRFAVSKE